jgi:hypothetical protein
MVLVFPALFLPLASHKWCWGPVHGPLTRPKSTDRKRDPPFKASRPTAGLMLCGSAFFDLPYTPLQLNEARIEAAKLSASARRSRGVRAGSASARGTSAQRERRARRPAALDLFSTPPLSLLVSLTGRIFPTSACTVARTHMRTATASFALCLRGQ